MAKAVVSGRNGALPKHSKVMAGAVAFIMVERAEAGFVACLNFRLLT
jgi:hypothetical protein